MAVFLNKAFEKLKKLSKQNRVSWYDVLLVIDIVVLYIKLSFFNVDKNMLLKLYCGIYKPVVAFGIVIVWILVIFISTRTTPSKIFFVSNDLDGISRGHDQEVGAKRYLKIMHFYFHQLWIIIFTIFVMSGAFTLSTIFNFNIENSPTFSSSLLNLILFFFLYH